MDSSSKELLRIEPNELRFSFETKKQISCTMQLSNGTDEHIAFKVKNNNPQRYCVLPNISIVPPRSTCNVNVTMGAQSEAPLGMQCEDKFLVQSVVVTEGTTVQNLTQEKFKKGAGNVVDEVNLKVIYVQPPRQSSPLPDMDYISKTFLLIEPDALCFPFETGKEITCSMQLTNITGASIAFKVKNTNPTKYWVRPNISIVRPRSTYDINVIMKAHEAMPLDMQSKDMFLVQNIVVKEGTTTMDLNDEMFKKHVGNVVGEVKLKVFYVQPPSPRKEESEEGSSPHPSSSNGGSKNDQDEGFMLRTMTLQQLKDITNNFCDKSILGKGGFGVVYKGVLENRKIIAVKKLAQSLSGSPEQFLNEATFLMKLKHPNIVRLEGYCYETQHLHHKHEGKIIFAESTECLLCLEYLPKGSLEKYISDASTGFDWPTRYKIIEGISYGLQYLHELADDPIIHLDLKPGNILLDDYMIPKVTDFGLSRLYVKNQTIHTKNHRGTLGYMPPEYIRGIITPMWDIFSLGVIIWEIITGDKDYPTDIRKNSTCFIERELQKWRNALQEKQGFTSLEVDCQQIKRCLQVGLICLNRELTKRPTMKRTIDMLRGPECMNWYISNELMSTTADI
ncbi:unnamed protein product [Alopecurus aequalis]